jgi:SAM-dependent methyltransferase
VENIAQPRRLVLINAGSGPRGRDRVPALFENWKHIHVDIDPAVEPDLVASVTDLSVIPSGSADAVWSAHCIEHLFAHEVRAAIAEFRRVLRSDGFACIIVPDLQAIAEWIATDRLHETIYDSSAGPVTAHDMLWGFGPAIEHGEAAMAHRCGFTPSVFLQRASEGGFAEIVLRRRASLELAGLCLCQPSADPQARDAIMAQLGL